MTEGHINLKPSTNDPTSMDTWIQWPLHFYHSWHISKWSWPRVLSIWYRGIGKTSCSRIPFTSIILLGWKQKFQTWIFSNLDKLNCLHGLISPEVRDDLAFLAFRTQLFCNFTFYCQHKPKTYQKACIICKAFLFEFLKIHIKQLENTYCFLREM